MHHQYYTSTYIMSRKYFSLHLLLFALSIQSLVQAEQVTINISAKVIESTCSISSETSDFIVTMQPADARSSTVGTPFGETPFAIKLVNCPADAGSVHVKFSGSSDANSPNLLQINNTNGTDAKGFAIGLYDKNRNNLNIVSNATTFAVDSSEAQLDFYAAYIRTSNAYTAGKVTAVVSFDVSYD